MPIYEYRCAACGHDTEALQKMTDAPLRKCPACGKAQLRRLVSAPQFRLKGSGWYETDFKDKNEKKRNLVGGESEAAAESSSDASVKEGAKKEVAEAKGDASKTDSAAKKPKPAAKSPAPKKSAKPKAGRSARA
jgi:putative FmdB family regulatory protein